MKVANFYVLVNTRISALLVETGFMSNARDVQLLSDRGFQAELVAAVGEGLAGHLNLKRKTKEEEPVDWQQEQALAEIEKLEKLGLIRDSEVHRKAIREGRPLGHYFHLTLARRLAERQQEQEG